MSVVYPLHGGEDEMSWQERALCAQTDPESFFPEKGGSTREAKRVCTGCDVKGDCLEYALANFYTYLRHIADVLAQRQHQPWRHG